MKFYETSLKKRESTKQDYNFRVIMPPVMSKEITLDLCWDAFKHSHLFRNQEVHFLRYVATLVKLTYGTPGELIYKKGKNISGMVYIINGVVQVYSAEDGETPILSLSGGTLLGESTLCIDHPSVCTVVCQSYTEMCLLRRKDFYKCYKLYPNEFRSIINSINKRYDNAKHYYKVSRYQLQETQWKNNSQVLTMRWLKTSLHKLLDKQIITEHQFSAQLNSEARDYETVFEKVAFCVKFLDLLVIANDIELDTNTVLMKTTWPIIFQPDTLVIGFWNTIIVILASGLCLTFIFFLCLSTEYIDLYSLYIAFVTIIWILDIYVQLSTAIKTKDTIINKLSQIAVYKISTVTFYLDFFAAVPIEIIFILMLGFVEVQTFHIMQSNRLLKVSSVCAEKSKFSQHNLCYFGY